MKGLEEHR